MPRNRTAILILAALIAGAPGLPLRAGDAVAGAAAYARDCARCHRDAEALRAAVATAPDPVAALDAFLARHRAPDPARRADIVAWLTAPR